LAVVTKDRTTGEGEIPINSSREEAEEEFFPQIS